MPTTTIPAKTLKEWTPKFKPGDVIQASLYPIYRWRVDLAYISGEGVPTYRMTNVETLQGTPPQAPLTRHPFQAIVVEGQHRLVDERAEPAPILYSVDDEIEIEHAHEVGTWLQQSANSKPRQIEEVVFDVNDEPVYAMRDENGNRTYKSVERVDRNWLLAPMRETFIRIRHHNGHPNMIGHLESVIYNYARVNGMDVDVEVVQTARADTSIPHGQQALYRNQKVTGGSGSYLALKGSNPDEWRQR